MENLKILAIIVAYYPDRETLLALVDELRKQVTEIIIVDNTPAENDNLWEILRDRVDTYPLRILRLGKNLGVATAINVGIDVAIIENFSHVLLSDQDSLPFPKMVSGLLQAERVISDTGQRVGAVGPVYIDTVTGIRFPFQVQQHRKLFYSRRHANENAPDVETLCLISSGSLINISVFRDVDVMREDFFIDHVDVEWCHRAISKGYVLVGTSRGLMQHHMGDACLRAWFFGWHHLNGYSPTRLYYRFRNFTYLLRFSYIPFFWKVRASWHWLGNLYAHTVFSSDRKENLKAILSGIWDGLSGKMGVH